MAVTSETEIMNSALQKLGAARIISPDDDNNRARLMKACYPILRDKLLRSHPWNFCTDYASLALITPKPAEIFDYDFVYQLPSDTLRVASANVSPNDEWEEISGKRIAANCSPFTAKIIRKIIDVTKYDDNFVEVLAWSMAANNAYALTQSNAMKESAEKNFKEELAQARSFDAQVGSVRRVQAEDWIDSRRY